MRKTIFFSLFLGLACIFPSRAMAQTVEFRILIDIDDDPGTGCTVSTVDGPVTGVDQILITTVDQTTQMVSGVSLSTCSSGVFGPPVPISAGGWPIGQGLGLAGSDVVETYYPTDMLNPPNGQIRVALVANDQLMSEDALLDNQGEPLWIRLFVPVPTLSSILLLVFILALFGFGLYFLRKYPEQRGALVLLLCLGGLLFVGFSSAISLDGDPSDWNVAPLAMDPSGDNGSAPDVLAFFGCVDGIYPRPQTVFFRIDAVLNQPPTANPSSLSLLEDDPATTIALSGSDPEGQSLTFSIVNPPANGSLSAITPTGPTSADIDYTPNPDFFGNDSFTFIVNDGLANSAPATVSLTIDPINDAPSFAAGPDLTIDKDTGPQTAPNWATNIAAGPPNESGQVLTFNIVNNSNPGLFSASGQPAVASNGTLTFENEPDVNGFADIELQLMDDGGTANGGVDVSPSQTFRITFNAVNDCPVAQNDAVMTDEDTPLAGDVLIDNGSGADSDIDGPGLLLVTAVNGNAAAVGVATMLPSGALLTQNANGTFNYDPNGAFDALAPGETDTDSWVYTLDDSSGLCAETATVTVTISGVNDCPTAVADALSTDEDTPTSGNVLANNGSGPDSDPESDPLTVVAVEGMPANVGVQITLTSGALLTVNSDGSFSYDPNGQFEALGNGDSANDSFTYAIDDGSMTCSEVATATVTINGVNDCPTAQPDAVVTDEDTALNGDVLADNGSGPDSDPESDPLVVSAVNGNPANVGVQITLASGALLTVNANGTFAYDPNGQFESLGPGDTDSDSFTYTIDDGSGCSGLAQLTETVAITINGLNDCPVAVDDSFSTDEDTPIMGDVLVANPTTADSDPDGGTLAVVAVQGMPANVGMLVTLPSGAQVTVNANGSFSYDPNGAFESLGTGDMGMDSFTYSIDDGSMACSEQATVTVALNGINDCPVAVNDAVSTDEATVLNGDLLAANPTTPDSDPEGNPISVTAVNGNAGNVGMQIALGSGLLTVNANGTFSFDPNGAYETLGAGDSAMESFTYTIDDGSGCAETATVNLTINGVNDCPVAVDDTFSTDEDMVLNGDVLAANPTTTDSDIESDPLNVTAVNGNAANVGMMFALPSGAQLTVNANGTFSYNPMGAFSLPGGSMTTDSFTYTIDDGSMACAEIATVTITVIGVNDPPMVTDDSSYQTHGNVTLEVGLSSSADALTSTFGNVLANDTDSDGPGPLIVTTIVGSGDTTAPYVGTTTLGGTVTMEADGTFHYTPPAGVIGMADTFQYTVSDQALPTPGTANGTVTITISNSRFWFVDADDVAGPFNGTTLDPFQDLTQLAGATTGTGDVIFIYRDTITTPPADLVGSITLLNNQVLVGQGSALTVTHPESMGMVTLVSASMAPAIANAGAIVNLADGNTVFGLNLHPSSGAGILGNMVSGVTLSNLIIEPTGSAHGIEFSGSGTFNGTALTIDSPTSSTGTGLFLHDSTAAFGLNNTTVRDMATGINLDQNSTQSVTFNGTTEITNSSIRGIRIYSNNAAMNHDPVTFNVLNLTSTMGTGMLINEHQAAIMVTAGNLNHSGAYLVDMSLANGLNLSGTTISGAGTGVRFASCTGNYVVPSFTVNSMSASHAVDISSSGMATFTFATLDLTTNGSSALRINNGGTVSWNNTSQISSNNALGVDIQNTGFGAGVTLSNATVTGNAGGVNLVNNTGTFTFADLDINVSGGTALSASGGGTLNIDPTDMNGASIQATNQQAINLVGMALNVNLSTLSSSNSPGVGINLNNCTGTFIGDSGSISSAAGIGINIDNGSPTFSYAGNLTNTASRVVSLANRTGGTVTLSGNINETGTGILISGNSGGSAVFSGTSKTLNTGTAHGVTLTGSSGHTTTFSNGGLAITTNGGGTGITGSNGGTLEVLGSNNTISATNGIALSLAGGTIIGGSGMTGGLNFLSISASGANNGIVLDSTGVGRLVVTGTGTTDGSGGTLQNINNNGIELVSANNISLSNMDLLDANLTDNCGTEAYDEFSGMNPGNQACRAAIYLRNVMHITLDNLTIDDTVDQGINGVGVTHFRLLNSEVLNAGNNSSESAILLRDLFGTVSDGNVNVISNTTVSGAAQIGVFIRNLLRTNGFAGEPDRLELTNSSFLLSAATDNGDNVTVSLRDDDPFGNGNGANFETVVTGCTFNGRFGASNTTDQIQVDAGINAKSQVSITGSTFTNSNTGINISGADGSQTSFFVDANPTVSVRFGNGINVAANGTASMEGTISNHPNIDSDQPNNPAFGIVAIVDNNGSLVLDIDNNTITDFLLPVRAGARGGTGTASVTLQNNDMTSSAVTGFGVVDLICGNGTVGESNSCCFNILNNDALDPMMQGEYFITMTPGTTCSIEGYGGAANDQAAIEAYVDGNQNSGATTVCTVGFCGIGIVNYSNSTCSTP